MDGLSGLRRVLEDGVLALRRRMRTGSTSAGLLPGEGLLPLYKEAWRGSNGELQTSGTLEGAVGYCSLSRWAMECLS